VNFNVVGVGRQTARSRSLVFPWLGTKSQQGPAILVFTLVLGAMAGSASAQTFVQATASSPGTSANTFSASFPSNTTAGNLILVGFNFNSTVSFASIADSQGNVFKQVGNQLTTPGGASSRLYYASNIKGGADAITVTVSAPSTYLEVYLSEYSGVNRITPIDAQAGASGSAGAVSSGGALTSAAGDLIFGFCVGDSTCTGDPGYSIRSNFKNNLVEDRIGGGPAMYAATATANDGWTMQMVALSPAGAGATPANSCDLAAPYGVVDSSDVQAAINMSIGLSPCAANVNGPNVCDVVVVQRVINASLTGNCMTGTPAAHTVSLNWTGSVSSGVVGYKIYRGTISGGPYALLASVGATTTFSDSSIQAGQTYYYVITAIDTNNNESAYSAQATAAIPVS
jgi:hypothetical protein